MIWLAAFADGCQHETAMIYLRKDHNRIIPAKVSKECVSAIAAQRDCEGRRGAGDGEDGDDLPGSRFPVERGISFLFGHLAALMRVSKVASEGEMSTC